MPAAPAMLAAPAPQPTHNRRAAAGRAFPLGRSCGPATVQAGHALAQRPPPLSSLHDPRHRSCTGSRLLAALPALDALRHCSGKAAAAGSGLELRNETESSSCAWPNSAHNTASVIRNCKQLPCCLWQHSYNSCYAHNRPRRPAAASGQGLRSGSGKAAAPALSGAARSCCTLLQQHGPGFGQWSAASRPAAAARCCSSTGRARQGGALAHPAAPAHLPTQRKQRQSRACRPGFPCCCSIEKAPPGDKAGRAFLLPASTRAGQKQQCGGKRKSSRF